MAKSKKDKELLDLCTKRYTAATQNANFYHSVWRDLEKVYLGEVESVSDEANQDDDLKRSNLRVKHAFQQIQTLAPRFTDPDIAFAFTPRNSQNDERVKAVKAVVNYFLDRDHFTEKQIQFILPALIYGLSVAKVSWSKDVRKRRVRKQNPTWQERLMGKDTEVVEVVYRNQPTVQVVDIFDFFWQPGAADLDHCDYVFHRSWLDSDTLKRREKQGIYKDVKYVTDGGGGGGTLDGMQQRRAYERPEDRDEQRGDKYEVVEMWTRDGLVTFVPGLCILREATGEDAPYWHGELPFAALYTQYSINNFVGLSEVWSIADIQEQIWTMENQRIDAVSLTLDPVFLVHRSLDGGGEFNFERGARIIVDQMNQVEQFQMHNLQAAGIEEVQQYISYMETVSGATKQLSGGSAGSLPPGTKTATAFAIQNKEANQRMQLKLQHVNNFYSRIAEQFLALSQQFITDPVDVRVANVLGERWVSVGPDDVAGMYDVKVRASTESANTEIERQQLMDLMGTFMPLMQTGVVFPDGTTIDGKLILSRYLESYNIEPDQVFRLAPPPMDPAMAGGGPVGDPAMAQPPNDPSIMSEDGAMQQMGIDPMAAEQMTASLPSLPLLEDPLA